MGVSYNYYTTPEWTLARIRVPGKPAEFTVEQAISDCGRAPIGVRYLRKVRWLGKVGQEEDYHVPDYPFVGLV